jgi:hypothetical protein
MNINSNIYSNSEWLHDGEKKEKAHSDLIKFSTFKKSEGCTLPDSTTDIRHQLVAKPPLRESVGCFEALPSRWSKGPSMLMML